VCIVAEESSPWGVAGGVCGGRDEFSGKLMLMLIVLGAGGVGGGRGRSNRRGLRMTCIFLAPVLQDGLAFGVPIGNSNGPLRVGRRDGGRSEAFGSIIPEAFGEFCPKEARVGKSSAVKRGGGGVMMDFAWSTVVGVGVGIQTGRSGRQGALH
jgi:hypothetical protein